MNIGARRSYDGIGICGLACHNAPVLFKTHRHCGLSIGALCHGGHLIELQAGVVVDHCFDALERGIYWAVAGLFCAVLGPVHDQGHFGLVRTVGAADHMHGLELDPVRLWIGGNAHQCDQILVVDFLFAVGQFFEPHEHILELVVAQFIAEVLQLGAQRGAARVFAHDDICLGQTYVLWAHDLECLGVFEHTVLVDAALMGKGVLAHNRFVELHGKSAHACYAARDVHQFGAVDASLVGHDVVADLHGHHNFFECGVTCTLAQAVDCALNLARASLDSGQ